MISGLAVIGVQRCRHRVQEYGAADTLWRQAAGQMSASARRARSGTCLRADVALIGLRTDPQFKLIAPFPPDLHQFHVSAA